MWGLIYCALWSRVEALNINQPIMHNIRQFKCTGKVRAYPYPRVRVVQRHGYGPVRVITSGRVGSGSRNAVLAHL